MKLNFIKAEKLKIFYKIFKTLAQRIDILYRSVVLLK